MTTLLETESFWEKVCFDRQFKPQGRFQVYRELVTERLVDVLHSICPVAKSLLSEEQWWDLLWEFLQNQRIENVILREFPWEFSQYLKAHPFPHQSQFPFLAELIEYEYLEVRVAFAPEDSGKAPAGKLRINPAHCLASYGWPVHFISEEFCDPVKLPRGVFNLLLWRNPLTLDVAFMEVNPLVAAAIRSLETGPLDQDTLLKKVAEENQIPLSSEYLAEGESLLQDLKEKKIL